MASSLFIWDIYNYDFFGQSPNQKVSRIRELAVAYQTIQTITKAQRVPLSREFVNDVLPILEVALQWRELKESKKISNHFVERVQKNMNYFGSNFRGTIFELDMATRCLLSNWEIDFPEDYTKEDKAVDMIAEKTDGEKIAIECSSKRGTQTLDIQKINETIKEKDEKFQPEYLELLKTQCKTKAIILDLTRSNYVNPIEQLDLSEISSCNNADGVVLTWREDLSKEENHSIRIKYKCLGNIPDKYFTTTWAAEFHKGPVFFLRKYVEPEPAHGAWGQEETCPK